MRTFRMLYSTATVLLATQAAMAVLYSALPARCVPRPAELGARRRRHHPGRRRPVVRQLRAGRRDHPVVRAEDARAGRAGQLQQRPGRGRGAEPGWGHRARGQPRRLVPRADPAAAARAAPHLLLRQYETAARTDTKTGLANATHWSHVARSELSRAERDDAAVGILMLDLDHFKQINDTYGHLTGDAVLKAVADALRKQTREYDLVGRFGGEEFMVLLPGIEPIELAAAAERFRQCIGNLIITSPDTREPVTVTASAGAVAYPYTGSDLDQLLLAADAALYQAKETGRNRTCLAPEPAGGLPAARTWRRSSGRCSVQYPAQRGQHQFDPIKPRVVAHQSDPPHRRRVLAGARADLDVVLGQQPAAHRHRVDTFRHPHRGQLGQPRTFLGEQGQAEVAQPLGQPGARGRGAAGTPPAGPLRGSGRARRAATRSWRPARCGGTCGRRRRCRPRSRRSCPGPGTTSAAARSRLAQPRSEIVNGARPGATPRHFWVPE